MPTYRDRIPEKVGLHWQRKQNVKQENTVGIRLKQETEKVDKTLESTLKFQKPYYLDSMTHYNLWTFVQISGFREET